MNKDNLEQMLTLTNDKIKKLKNSFIIIRQEEFSVLITESIQSGIT